MTTQEPTYFVVGTRNSNGEEYFVFTDRAEAESHVVSLLVDGFEPEELLFIEGRSRQIIAGTTTVVDSLAFL